MISPDVFCHVCNTYMLLMIQAFQECSPSMQASSTLVANRKAGDRTRIRPSALARSRATSRATVALRRKTCASRNHALLGRRRRRVRGL